MDYVTCGTGSYFDFYKLIPSFLYADKLGPPFAAGIGSVLTHARVQAESHIRTPENADYVIASGQADMVSIVRGQIADPWLAHKAAAGRPEEVRGCISCNQMCWGRRHRDYWISCLVNPSAGREFEWGGDRFTPAGAARRVLVIGGGPAGLEAARAAAGRGHQVTLAEAGPQLGGRFRLAGLQPRRGQILELLAWYERQLESCQARVLLNTPLDGDEALALEPEVVVLATGATADAHGFQRALPQHDRLPGLAHGNVWPVDEVMGRACRPGRRVLVLDDLGHWEGCGTAWHLAEQGHAVSLVTPHAMAGWELVRTAADGPLRRKLKALGVEVITDCAVAEWHGDAATLVDLRDGAERRLDADALVTATCARSETGLQRELERADLPVHSIGDCVAPRRAAFAIYEGRELALRL